jgi:hypothetical protein
VRREGAGVNINKKVPMTSRGFLFFEIFRLGYSRRLAHMGYCPLRILLLALGAISIHRSGLEAALPEPLEDLVFREAEVRFI